MMQVSNLPTAGAVLDDWIGPAAEDAVAAKARQKLWFTKSAETDAWLTQKYTPLLAALTTGLAENWAARGVKARLAAIIALDQFSRNIFRDTPNAFANDALALKLTKDGLAKGEDKMLSEIERIFFYLPLEHSETLADQDQSIAVYTALAEEARPAFKPQLIGTLDFAKRHHDVILEFGRFPHRNPILGRANTPEETAYLAKPGSGF